MHSRDREPFFHETKREVTPRRILEGRRLAVGRKGGVFYPPLIEKKNGKGGGQSRRKKATDEFGGKNALLSLQEKKRRKLWERIRREGKALRHTHYDLPEGTRPAPRQKKGKKGSTGVKKEATGTVHTLSRKEKAFSSGKGKRKKKKKVAKKWGGGRLSHRRRNGAIH